jgi:hypothetical protein
VTTSNDERPKLIFFRDTPRDLLTRPPLASSLQNLETSFLLVSIGQYPHALVSCTAAIESALKAAFTTEKANLSQLLKLANAALPTSAFSQRQLDEFRQKRNEIIHYGFNPKDEEICAVLLLKTGYPLIEQCYRVLFDFSLKRTDGMYGGLLPDFDRHLDISERVYQKAKDEPNVNLTYCFVAFGQNIRWSIQQSLMSDWQRKVLDAEETNWPNKSWDLKEKQAEKLFWETLHPAWKFDCPICDDCESFICELDDDELDNARVRLKRGVCVNCGLFIPKNCPFLADEICSDQIDKERPKIFSELGIEQE